ncbi:MAG: outer membrane protein TolC [Flaviaesturariibacter sp.]|nr:outer membrane protein TolC [Flaviaesturariibacter sp.]
MRFFLTIALLGCSTLLYAQPDTLSLDAFFKLIKANHPLAKAAAIDVTIAKAGIMVARGAFDPVMHTNDGRKEVEGLLYYDQQQRELRIPTLLGVDIVTGTESLSGTQTPSTETKGQNSYLGFSMPLAKGLLFDKRRAAIQTARLFHRLSAEEQKSTLNDLLMDAATAYYNWREQTHLVQVTELSLANARQRLHLMKTAFELGDRPAIDTTEAQSLVRMLALQHTEVRIQQQVSRLGLENFLWEPENRPYRLSDRVQPENRIPTAPAVEELLQSVAVHPLLIQYGFKLKTLNVERRLKAQSLLPGVYLKYNQLAKSYDITKTLQTPWLQNNYRYGLSVALPLRLSEARGEYRQARLKLQQAALERDNKRWQVETKLRQYHAEYLGWQQQQSLTKALLASLQQLQNGEAQRFANGESSLFLLNARELKVLEVQQKLIALEAKLAKAALRVQWAAGRLWE